MRELVAAIIFAAVLVFLAVYWAREHQAIYAMPMVQASAPICPHFEAHPCARINCRRNIA